MIKVTRYKVLFLTLSNVEDINQRGIYTDLVREIAHNEVEIYVVSPRERRINKNTEVVDMGLIHNLRIRTGNITKTSSLLEKGLSTLLIDTQYINAIKQHWGDVKFDLIMYSTPPITFVNIIQYFKKHHKCLAYLILKDIFPQNAIDLGMLKKNLIWAYFRYKEKRLYRISDFIGCMSRRNMEFILKENPSIDPSKIEVFPNAIKPFPRKLRDENRKNILIKYNIPTQATLFLYGGNLGKPQGIDFLLEVVNNFDKVKNGYLLIVGSGTEYKRIELHLNAITCNNVCLLSKLSKGEYDLLSEAADVGLIFLDKRFTIPNFPSRLTSYMENMLPVLAATDKNTDLGDVIVNEARCGFWLESGDLFSFISYANDLSTNAMLRIQMGESGRNFLEKHYDITTTVRVLLKHLTFPAHDSKQYSH